MQSAKELEAKLKAAERRLETLTEQVRRIDAQVRASDVDVTVSIGIAEFTPGDGDTDLKSLCDALILKADVALYGAKGAGRDRVVVEAA